MLGAYLTKEIGNLLIKAVDDETSIEMRKVIIVRMLEGLNHDSITVLIGLLKTRLTTVGLMILLKYYCTF